MNIPNILTLLRLLFPIVISLLFLIDLDYSKERFIVLTLFILFSITDFFDGYIARKLNQESVFGKIFDPVSDKVLSSSALIYILTFQNDVLIPALLIITREFIVSGNREFMLVTNSLSLKMYILLCTNKSI